jgi:hypothetical protein
MGSEDGEQESEPDPTHKCHQETGVTKRQLGEAIVLVLFFAIDAYEVWPDSHLIALAAGVGGLSAVLYGELSAKKWFFWTAGFCAASTLFYFAAPPPIPRDTDTSGVLVAGDEPMPPNGCDKLRPSDDFFLVLFGDNGIRVRKGPPVSPIIAYGRPLITLQQTSDGMLVSSEIYNAEGEPVAVIKDNSFHALTGGDTYAVREGLSTLAVYQSQWWPLFSGRKELLYVRYLNPTTVRFRGVFPTNGRPITLISDKGIGTQDGSTGKPILETTWINSCMVGSFAFR